MLDSSGLPIDPNDLGALGRRVKQIERQLELMGGQRALTQASIGRGGLRVLKGGDIRIEGTGSLIIDTGNLVLGAGKIDGSALKSQLEPQGYSDSESNIGLTSSYATKASVSVKVPSWATTTIVQAYCQAQFYVQMSASDANWNGLMRAQIASSTSMEATLQYTPSNASSSAYTASGSLSYAASVDTTSVSSVAVNLQARSLVNGVHPTNSGSKVALSVVALFFR